MIHEHEGILTEWVHSHILVLMRSKGPDTSTRRFKSTLFVKNNAKCILEFHPRDSL